jgi:hypothetical protein
MTLDYGKPFLIRAQLFYSMKGLYAICSLIYIIYYLL